MAPRDYAKARKEQVDSCLIHERPYLPQLTVDPNDEESIRSAVARIFSLNDNNNSSPLSSSWTVEAIAGGITNRLFRVSGIQASTFDSSKEISDSCLVRIFGAEGMIDRDVENATYSALASQQLAPPYYGRFQNGRVEGWMDGMRPLEIKDLQDLTISEEIAKTLAHLHAFSLPPQLQDVHPIDKPSLWTQLEDWFQQANEATFLNQHDTERAASLNLPSIHQELAWIKDSVVPKEAAVVFCHNDLLAANVLYNDSNQEIQLIDFEYGGINYAAFDIANHFNEWAGGPPTSPVPDYNLFPSAEQQRDFVATYLQAAAATSSTKNGNNHLLSPTDKEVDDFLRQIQAFVLANHLYWGLWAVNQAATEGCEEYDYMLYAMQRFQQYRKCKAEWK